MYYTEIRDEMVIEILLLYSFSEYFDKNSSAYEYEVTFVPQNRLMHLIGSATEEVFLRVSRRSFVVKFRRLS